MASEKIAKDLSTSVHAAPAERFWVRLRFRKDGDLRFVSHHDLMNCFERMLRRADLPFCSSEGFHPKPRMNFALSLGLGIVGCNEVVELAFANGVNLEEIQDRLRRQAPPGLTILDVRRRPGSMKAQVYRVTYRFPVPASRYADGQSRLAQLLESPQCLVQRLRPRPRLIDLRPYLDTLHLDDHGLTLRLWVTPTGTARPEEVLRLLGLQDLLAAGAVLERVHLELKDEEGQAVWTGPPEVLAKTAPPGGLNQPATQGDIPVMATDDEENAAMARPTLLISSPMAFNS